MTAEEIKSKIEFKQEQESAFRVRATGQITFSYSILVDRWEANTDRHFKMMEEVKKNIREAIVRNIFDDQRKELCEALDELIQNCSPAFLSGNKFFEAQERLMKAARYQPHFHSTSGGKNE